MLCAFGTSYIFEADPTSASQFPSSGPRSFVSCRFSCSCTLEHSRIRQIKAIAIGPSGNTLALSDLDDMTHSKDRILRTLCEGSISVVPPRAATRRVAPATRSSLQSFLRVQRPSVALVPLHLSRCMSENPIGAVEDHAEAARIACSLDRTIVVMDLVGCCLRCGNHAGSRIGRAE